VALELPAGEPRRYADRVVQHVLTHLATPATLERLLAAATSGNPVGRAGVRA
jgi:hypothetical protein